MIIVTETEELECIAGDPADSADCAGPVLYRMALSSTGRSFPRCEKHWNDRLALEDRLRADYPDSPNPPAWFDPADAGERWDDDY